MAAQDFTGFGKTESMARLEQKIAVFEEALESIRRSDLPNDDLRSAHRIVHGLKRKAEKQLGEEVLELHAGSLTR